MKKALSVMIACLVFASLFGVFASAEDKLPFDLVAPGSVTAAIVGGDSPTTVAISYSLTNEMTKFFKDCEDAHSEDRFGEFIAKYGIDDISITTQVDWAVDDVNDSISGWHANDYWKGDYGFGYDSEHRVRVGIWDGVDLWIGNCTETVNDHWVTRGVAESDFNGDPEGMIPGLKDQMRADQYTYSDEELRIDYSKHTVYYRMRFVVTTYKDTEDGTKSTFYYSDWSNTASVGKDADVFEPLTAKDLPAPVITGLRKTDKEFNDCPVVAFTLEVPDDLADKNTKVTAHGGTIVIETYARVKGDTEWTGMANTDWVISAGERECALIHLINEDHPSIPKDTVIELRCRYRCSQAELDDVYSEYSKIISFGTDDIGLETGVPADQTPDPSGDPSGRKSNCPICHFCPQPLGLCIFIWLLIILAVIIVIIIIIAAAKKSKKKENK